MRASNPRRGAELGSGAPSGGSMAAVRVVHQSALLTCILLALGVNRPTFGQTSLNVERMGSAPMPPVPDNTTPGEASDIWVSNGFAYVGRYDNDPLGPAGLERRVEVFDARNPRAPSLFCSIPMTPATSIVENSYVEDVLVEGRFLYVAQQDTALDIDGVRIHDLGVDPSNPNCISTADTFAPIVPSAHNLFVYRHFNGSSYLLVAVQAPQSATGVHALNIDDPANPVHVAFWSHPPDPALAYCTNAMAGCAVHDVHAQRIGSQDLLFVAALRDGVYVLDLTDVETPGFDLQNETIAHFGYTWTTPDVDGDTLPDLCDTLGRRNPAFYLGPTFNNISHDAQITPDGTTIWTADEGSCGGHAKMWSLAQILDPDPLLGCDDADWCAVDEIAQVGEFRVPPDLATGTTNLNDPTLIHQVRFEGSFCFATWYEEGLRILDISDPTLPVEIGAFDTVVPNTDGCFENNPAQDDCASGSANRMLNRGFFGVWGVSWDDCYLYLSERGSPDNNGGLNVVGAEGEMLVLRYTGGPTTPQPLRITKDLTSPGNLVASWGEVPFATAFNIYRGTIPKTATGGGMGTRPPGSEYDHTLIDLTTCNIVGNSRIIVSQFTPPGDPCNDGLDNDFDTLIDCADLLGPPSENCSTDQSCQPFAFYYLVTTRSPCDLAALSPRPEGNYGQDSLGVNRPPAILRCP